jgi:hypothetical protein
MQTTRRSIAPIRHQDGSPGEGCAARCCSDSFPIALFVMSVLFDLVAHRTKNPAVAVAAYYNAFAAAI